jgi:hypothetical protein
MKRFKHEIDHNIVVIALSSELVHFEAQKIFSMLKKP